MITIQVIGHPEKHTASTLAGAKREARRFWRKFGYIGALRVLIFPDNAPSYGTWINC